MSFIESIISKLTLKELGTHLGNYANLYVRPVRIWKKVISNRKNGYDLFILHLIYYSILAFFILKDFTLALPLVLLEIIITTIPLLIFLIPFLFFCKFFNKNYKWNKLFRLFVILKLQFVPLFTLVYLPNKNLKVESLYMLIDNLIPIIWIAFIIIFPLVINIDFWKKLVWIISNYVFFLIGALLIGLFFENLDPSGKVIQKLSIESPNAEYESFKLKQLYTPLLLTDSLYFVRFKLLNDTAVQNIQTQFVTYDLHQSFIQSRIDALNSTILLLDSVKMSHNKDYNDTLKITAKISGANVSSTPMTISYLDTLKLAMDYKFNLLLAETKKLKDSAKFQSSREYFSALYFYLEAYQYSYVSGEEIGKIISISPIDGTVKLDSMTFGAMFKLDTNYYSSTKNKFKKIELRFEDRARKSTFVINILLWPLELVLEKLGYFD